MFKVDKVNSDILESLNFNKYFRMNNEVDWYGTYLALKSTLLCLFVEEGGQIANFGVKNPQVHLSIISEWPENNSLPV